MCFQCTAFTSFYNNLVYVVERIACCLAMTALVTCIIITLVTMISVGIGLGYNYCFVDMKTTKIREQALVDIKPKAKLSEIIKHARVGNFTDRIDEGNIISERIASPERWDPDDQRDRPRRTSGNETVKVFSIAKNFDELIQHLTKLKADGKNYSIEVIT